MTQSPRIAIVGGGIMGRLLAYLLADVAAVTLYEERPEGCWQGAASGAAGGMLAPFSELETFDDQLLQLSLSALGLWRRFAEQADFAPHLNFAGTLIVNHGGDSNLQRHLAAKWQRLGCGDAFTTMPHAAERMPWPSHLKGEGLWLPDEGVVDNQAVLTMLGERAAAKGAKLCFGQKIKAPFDKGLEGLEDSYECILDTRGIGAQRDLTGLRGVRGEAVVLQLATGGSTVDARWQDQPTVRLLHPRYPIYLIPRPNNRMIVGASTIESDDDGPVSVRSLLELLSAAFSIHPSLAEARVVDTRTGVRAAFDDNLPRILRQGDVYAINGLYRHGFLLAPAMAAALIARLTQDLGIAGLEDVAAGIPPEMAAAVYEHEEKKETGKE